MILSEIRTTYYPEVEEDVFWEIVRLDPTYNPERHEKKGHYTGWLLTLYRQGGLREEDYKDATEYLTAFEANKRRLEERDIGRYRTLPDLYDAVMPYLAKRKVSRKSLKKNEATKVYVDDEWTVVVPHTWEASKLYGSGTRWCTASTDTDAWFKRYTINGELYICIERKGGAKYQMLALRNGNVYQYCYDASDRSVMSGKIGLSSGAVDFFNQHFQFTAKPLRFYWNREFAFAQVDITNYGLFRKKGQQWQHVLENYKFVAHGKIGKNMIHCQEARLGKCLVDMRTLQVTPVGACDYCNEFDGDYTVAWKDAKIGVMDRQGTFHKGPELLKECVRFCNGIGPVGLYQNAYNFVDEQGNLVFDSNFKWCSVFHDGFCAVIFENGVKGYVSSDRMELTLPEAHCVNDFQDGVAVVHIKDGKNLLRKDGRYVLADHVREIIPTGATGVCRIQLHNGRYTYCDTWWGLFTDKQFLVCKDFVMGLAAVRTEDGLWNYMQTDGTLLLKRGVDWCKDFDRNLCVGKIHTYRGDNFVNTDGELLCPWPKPKKHR